MEDEVQASLKLKLKRWEKTFYRIHGRKATKNDVKSASSEIQDLYRQYGALKRNSLLPPPPSEAPDAGEVFGPELNKPRVDKTEESKVEHGVSSTAIWRLPPLTDLQNTSMRKMKLKEPIKEVTSLTSELTTPTVDSSPTVVMAGAGAGRSLKGCGRHLSADWLQRCKPDFSTGQGTTNIPTSDIKLSKPVTAAGRTEEKKTESILGKILYPDDGIASRSLAAASSSCSPAVVSIEEAGYFLSTSSSMEDTSCSSPRVSDVSVKDDASMNVTETRNHVKSGMGNMHSGMGMENAESEMEYSVCKERTGMGSGTVNGEGVKRGTGMKVELGMDCTQHSSAVEGTELEMEEELRNDKSSTEPDVEEYEASWSRTGKGTESLELENVAPDVKDRVYAAKCPAPSTRGTSVSENFVQLNMKVKRYSRRPGRTLTGSAYKRMEWKKRQRGTDSAGRGKKGGGGGRYSCFKCGKAGHWARNCTSNGGVTGLGSFSGEKVKFSESVALDVEGGVDDAELEELQKESPFPTLREAAIMATTGVCRGKKEGGKEKERCDEKLDEKGFIPPSLPSEAPSSSTGPQIEPLFKFENRETISTPTSVLTALRRLGHTSFRPNQEAAVMRVLSGISTLVITATGSGKSLCYQLPAYLYRQAYTSSITLVISPLVSLMEDQVRRFPPALKGACLHTNLTQLQREKVLRNVSEGKVDVLLLSPEALVGGALWWKRKGCPYSLRDLPPVAFACIDEAHCISEWSHNFRPSYLRVYKILRDRLRVRCVLGLTATATPATGLSVAHHLGVADDDIIRGPPLPNNITISVSCDTDRDQALVELLSREPFASCDSIIIYCTRQQTTECVAQMIRTYLQSWNWNRTELNDDEEEESEPQKPTRKGRRKKASVNLSKRSRVTVMAESYHAGMSASQRKSVQNKFMSGSLRIVVATVAFGMGLDKSDVRAVLHYNMPKSFESYVQEIGRAGRDRKPAYSHVFIDNEGDDLCELRRHAYSNSVDLYTIKKIVEMAFPPCLCKTKYVSEDTDTSPSTRFWTPRVCGGHEIALPIEPTVLSLDSKEECLSTLLCYMELQGWLEVSNSVYDTCTLKCYGGARQLRSLARKVPVVAAAAAKLVEKGEDLDCANRMTFSVTEIACCMGWESHVLRSELNSLQHNDRGTGSAVSNTHSTILVEMEEPAFHLVSPGDLTMDERDHMIQLLNEKVVQQEKQDLEKLHLLYTVLKSVASGSQDGGVVSRDDRQCHDEGVDYIGQEQGQGEGVVSAYDRQGRHKLLSQKVGDIIGQYFSSQGFSESDLTGRGISPVSAITTPELSQEEEEEIRQDVALLVARFSDQHFTGRAIARLFHGIPSPRYPALVWGTQGGFWRKHLKVHFNKLCHIATAKLLDLRKQHLSEDSRQD